MKILTYLILFLHFQACTWWYVIEIKGRVLNYNAIIGSPDNIWYPPFNFLEARAIDIYDHPYFKTETAEHIDREFYKYSIMFYSSVMMFTLNDMFPVRNSELLYQVVFLMVSSLSYNYLFTELSEQINQLQKDSTAQ